MKERLYLKFLSLSVYFVMEIFKMWLQKSVGFKRSLKITINSILNIEKSHMLGLAHNIRNIFN